MLYTVLFALFATLRGGSLLGNIEAVAPGVVPSAGSLTSRVTCTHRGIISEDHWDTGKAHPFCLCEDVGGGNTFYNLPMLGQCAGWTVGEVLTLDLQEASLSTEPAAAAASTPAKAARTVSAKAGWQKEGGWIVVKVVEKSPPAKKTPERRGRSMMYDGIQRRRLLTLRLKYTDAEPVCDVACVEAGNVVIKSTIEAASYGQSSLIETRVITVEMGGPVAPLVGCAFSSNVSPQTSIALGKATDAGIDLSAYDHYELFLPDEADCDWGGLGSLSGKTTWEHSSGGYDPGIRVHELGHNFGLHHAGTVVGSSHCEYCDDTCPMGGAQPVGFVLPHLIALDWVQPTDLCTVRDNGKLALRSLREDPRTSTLGDCSGAIINMRGSGDDTALWASYRTADGIDSELWSTSQEKVTLHFGETRFFDHKTYRVAVLDVGDHYTAPTSLLGEAIEFDTVCGPTCTHVVKFCAKGAGAAAGVAQVAVAMGNSEGEALSRADAICTNQPAPPTSPAAPPPAPVAPGVIWQIESGSSSCELVEVSGRSCVTDGPGDYGNNENCRVRAIRDLTVSATAFDTEQDYDFLTVGGVDFSGTRGPENQFLSAGEVLIWASDSSIVRRGWTVCAVDGYGGNVPALPPSTPVPPPPSPSPIGVPLTVPLTPDFEGIFKVPSSASNPADGEWAYGLYGTLRRGFTTSTAALRGLQGSSITSPPPPPSPRSSPPSPFPPTASPALPSPPPQSPSGGGGTAVAHVRLGAQLSTTFSPQWPASNVIDGNPATVTASTRQVNAWVSVQTYAGSHIGHVAIQNRRESRFAPWLGAFEVYVGDSHGDRGYKCGGDAYSATNDDQRYVIDCHGRVGAYVTMLQTGPARYLTIAEVVPYSPGGSVVSPPSLSPPAPAPPPPPPSTQVASPPAPPAPAPPLRSMVKIERISARLSSTYHNRYRAAATIDGNYNSICASGWQQNAWLSVEVPRETQIDYVAVYNRVDNANYASWLNPFEVWVSETQGDFSLTNAVKCAGPVSAPLRINSDPANAAFVVACPAGTKGSYFSIRQVGQARYLTLLEVEAYANPATTASVASATVAVTGGGKAKGVAAVAQAAAEEDESAGLELPGYDDVNPPVEDASIYFVAGASVDAHVQSTPAATAAAATAAAAEVSLWQTAVITLGALLALTLLGTVALSLWVLQLRRSFKKVTIYPTAKLPKSHSCAKAGETSCAADAADVESSMGTVTKSSRDTSEASVATDAEMGTTWEPSNRFSHADI